MSFLNKIGLYTTKQVAQIVSEQTMRQARSAKETFENVQNQKILGVKQAMDELFQTHRIKKSDLHLSITPFFDSNNEMHWIVIQVPGFDNNVRKGTIEIKNWAQPSRVQEGFLYYEIRDDKVKIVDFRTNPQNRGIGTYVLNRLESIALTLELHTIYGYLGPADIDNRDAQVRFYSRNGYDIRFKDEARLEGQIVKRFS